MVNGECGVYYTSGTSKTNIVPSVMIYALNEIPEEWTKQLVPVNVK